ncbi:MAG: response regulator [Spirochaetia bacterium]
MTYELLIVDDEPLEREALRYIIQRCFTRISKIHDASNGREALELVNELGPQIVLMDVKMPGINGVEATRRILEGRPRTKIVFLTAYDYFEYAQQAVRLGAVDFIVKPASDERVEQVLSQIIESLDEENQYHKKSIGNVERLERATDMLEREFVRGLVDEELSHQEVAEYSEILDCNAPLAVTVSAAIDYEGYPTRVDTAEHRRVLVKRCGNALAARFEAKGFRVLQARDEGTVHFLLLPQVTPSAEDEVRQLVEKVAPAAAQEVRSEHSIPVYLGVDSTARPPQLAHRGFRHACVARAQAVSRSTQVVFHDRHGSSPRQTSYPYDQERKLFEAVRDGHTEHAKRIASEAVDRLALQGDEPKTIRRRLVELLTVVARRLETEPLDITVDEVGALDALESADSPTRLRTVMVEAALSLCHMQSPTAVQSSHTRIERVRAYLEVHYHENLSLEHAAAQARLSPQYLSRAFKKHVGMSFVDYVHAVRVRRAKTLLRDSQLSVKEIAAGVGFSDSNYFSRVFKQQCGLTPSEFRDKFFPLRQNRAAEDSGGRPTAEDSPVDGKIL